MSDINLDKLLKFIKSKKIATITAVDHQLDLELFKNNVVRKFEEKIRLIQGGSMAVFLFLAKKFLILFQKIIHARERTYEKSYKKKELIAFKHNFLAMYGYNLR